MDEHLRRRTYEARRAFLVVLTTAPLTMTIEYCGHRRSKGDIDHAYRTTSVLPPVGIGWTKAMREFDDFQFGLLFKAGAALVGTAVRELSGSRAGQEQRPRSAVRDEMKSPFASLNTTTSRRQSASQLASQPDRQCNSRQRT